MRLLFVLAGRYERTAVQRGRRLQRPESCELPNADPQMLLIRVVRCPMLVHMGSVRRAALLYWVSKSPTATCSAGPS